MTYNIKFIISLLIIAVIIFTSIFKLINFKIQKDVKKSIENNINKSGIEIKDSEGFLIYIPNSKNILSKKWSDIKKIELIANDSSLIILTKSGKMEKMQLIDYYQIDWACLIKAIPKNIETNNELNSFKNNYFSDLSCCDVCGKISVKDSICLSCASETYEKYYIDDSKYYEDGDKKFETKKEYLKRQQLFWFTTYIIENGKVDFEYKDILFENCKDWKPLVTDSEVIKYNETE